MTIKIDWTIGAKNKRDSLIAANPKLQSYFASTFQSLKNGEIKLPSSGRAEVRVEFTDYKLVLDVETDRIAKVKFVDIEEVK